MYGKNEVHSPFRSNETLTVNEVFKTIQGEGPDAGRPAIFVRLAKCNLRCTFCDTEFEHGVIRRQDYLAEVVKTMASDTIKLVVITGGEPLLQNTAPFVKMCNDNGLAVSIETAGTVFADGLQSHFSGAPKRWYGNIIVCSPKTPEIAASMIPLIGAYKYIVRANDADPRDGLPITSTQLIGRYAKLFRPPPYSKVPIYVQPCDESDPVKNLNNLSHATTLSMKYGYRLSLQLHKIAGVP
jgi:7-carboxy-7-deazaguanine synthase